MRFAYFALMHLEETVNWIIITEQFISTVRSVMWKKKVKVKYWNIWKTCMIVYQRHKRRSRQLVQFESLSWKPYPVLKFILGLCISTVTKLSSSTSVAAYCDRQSRRNAQHGQTHCKIVQIEVQISIKLACDKWSNFYF